jgi:sugar fermentation stimulation protein A
LLNFFQNIEIASFLHRPNRFVAECYLKGRRISAHLPNPGKLRELLLPDSRLFLAKHPGSTQRKTEYTVVAVEKQGNPVFLHTHLTNHVAHHLIEQQRVPGLEGFKVLKAEVPFGRSRFDFLLQKREKQFILEVKSCTLFGKEIAMFPDAVTLRGRKHLLELAELTKNRYQAGVLFIIHSPSARFFLPEYHTDLNFSRTLLDLRRKLFVLPLGIEWSKDLSLGRVVRPLEVPWGLAEKEAHDRGCYMVILKLGRNRRLSIGGLGEILFRQGYYLYVGSAMKNLAKRIQRHQRKRKRHFWHIDYLREHAEFCTALPVRTSTRLECDMAKRIMEISDWHVPGFGGSDCSCSTHLFGMKTDPQKQPSFIEALQYFRMDRLYGLISK